MNVLGNIAGAASTEWGLAVSQTRWSTERHTDCIQEMIWAAYGASRNDDFEASAGQVVGLFVGLLCLHGLLNSLKTRQLAFFTQFFVFSEYCSYQPQQGTLLHFYAAAEEPTKGWRPCN